MANLYAPGVTFQAGAATVVSDPNDAAAPNKTVTVPLVAVATAGGGTATAGTAADPNYSADSATTKTDRSVTASTTSQTAAPTNAARKRLLIQNQDAAINIFVNLGTAATAGLGSIRVGPGSSLDIEGSTQALNVIAASGTPAVTVWEF